MEQNRSGEYLTFRVAQQGFAMRTSHVRGILPASEIVYFDSEEFPSRGHICGVTSLQGGELPVIDLRAKLGLTYGAHGRLPCVIVVEVVDDGLLKLVGFVADRISDVVKLRDHDFCGASARVSGRARRVLDPAAIVAGDPLAVTLSSLGEP